MGCCTSAPVPEQQAAPRDDAPIKATKNDAAVASNSNNNANNAAANKNNNANRQVTVGGANEKAVQPAVVAASNKPSARGELKGAVSFPIQRYITYGLVDGGTEAIRQFDENKPFESRYEVSPGTLGKGHFAVVKKCRDIVTGSTYAVKIIDKKEIVKSSASVVKQEIEILKAVGAHPNCVQLIDHFEDTNKHYLVMELCSGGDLFSQIVEHGKYSEQEAVRCCRQLANALKHIHNCGITHRDLKPENILLESNHPTANLKIADFGLSKLIKGHLHPMRTVCGTWAYCLSEDTLVQVWDQSRKAVAHRPISTVKVGQQLLDEFSRPVNVKAIHTTAASIEKMWTVRDAKTNQLLFRCTADHKLSLLETKNTRISSTTSSFLPSPSTSATNNQSSVAQRVEIRCSDFFDMSPQAQSNYLAYSSSSSRSSQSHGVSHIASSFPIRIEAPADDAQEERYVGLEVDSDSHRFLLSQRNIVTSNCAPEVIQRKPYDSTVDNWTLGVLMYILLSGYHPFDVFGELPEPELLQKIITCSYDFDDPIWEGISQDAKELIRGLLVLDPSKRLSLDEYLNSRWVTGGGASEASNPLIVERLSKFSVGKSKFRALVVAKLASNKFKASLSRSKTRNANSKLANGEGGVPLLSNGEPDYLGLGSTRGGGRIEGLDSIREGGSRGNINPNSGRGHEASSTSTRGMPLSINGIDTRDGASGGTGGRESKTGFGPAGGISARDSHRDGDTDSNFGGEDTNGPMIHDTDGSTPTAGNNSNLLLSSTSQKRHIDHKGGLNRTASGRKTPLEDEQQS